MIITLVVMPIIGLVIIHTGNLDVVEAMRMTGETASLTGGKDGWAGAAVVIGGLSWGLGYFGQPQLVTKFMAIRNVEEVRIGRRVAIVWTALAYTGATLIGVVGITMVHGGLLPTGGLDDLGKNIVRPTLGAGVNHGHAFNPLRAGRLAREPVVFAISDVDQIGLSGVQHARVTGERLR